MIIDIIIIVCIVLFDGWCIVLAANTLQTTELEEVWQQVAAMALLMYATLISYLIWGVLQSS